MYLCPIISFPFILEHVYHHLFVFQLRLVTQYKRFRYLILHNAGCISGIIFFEIIFVLKNCRIYSNIFHEYNIFVKCAHIYMYYIYLNTLNIYINVIFIFLSGAISHTTQSAVCNTNCDKHTTCCYL